MKKLYSFLKISMVLIAIVSTYHSYAISSKKDSILLVGKIFNNEERVKDVVINVFDHNLKIKTIKVKSSNFVRTYLPKNTILTIEITAPNFHDKRFMFDSHVPDKLTKLPGYEFDMDIFSIEELSGVNTSLLDFPVGLVKYNSKKKIFIRDKDYTKRMKKLYFQLLEEAQMSERGTLKDD
ncbi:MAG: hypothetical protein DWP98_00765 [Bacteroidetes bacterium]|nr:MAG: hypothetical protein DWP98_00765 [Bacteroidota bacterium]MBL1144792.1 hypothetical protein [Bacteroidota bacterium]NOG57586.1 hypothetical protein [Bacteroidota bacterium]